MMEEDIVELHSMSPPRASYHSEHKFGPLCGHPTSGAAVMNINIILGNLSHLWQIFARHSINLDYTIDSSSGGACDCYEVFVVAQHASTITSTLGLVCTYPGRTDIGTSM